jgi:hypothetical protein
MRAKTLCAILLALVNVGVGHKVWLDNDLRAFEREMLASRLAREADNLRYEAEMAELDSAPQGTVSAKAGPCPTGW